MCVYLSVCWFVCLLFIGHTTFVHFAALPPSGRESRSRRRGRPRARGQAHAQREHARACRTTYFSTKKSLRWCLSKTKPYARAHAVVYVTAEIFQKKGKRKPTCHFPSSVYSLPSLGVFTFRIVLNRTWSLVGADLGQLVYTYKRVVCVCWFVGLLVCFLSATRHLSTLRRCLRVAERAGAAVASGPARAGKHAQRSSKSTRAHAVQHTVVYVTVEIFKKREKENQHATSQVQFTVCLLLECLLFESYWIVFFTNRVCWPPWNHGEPGDLPSLRRRG